MEGLEDVKQELETKRQELARELESARGKIAAIEKDLERVDEALASLTGKKPRARSGRSKKPVPTADELRTIVVAVREDLPFAGEAELEKAVRSRVRKEGKSLAGFKDLYAQARPVDEEPLDRDSLSGFRQAS